MILTTGHTELATQLHQLRQIKFHGFDPRPDRQIDFDIQQLAVEEQQQEGREDHLVREQLPLGEQEGGVCASVE